MILTVQSTGRNSYRLGINLQDSINTFNSERGASVNLIVGELELQIKTTCGPPLSKGFDLYSKALSIWIVQNNHNGYLPGQPTKLNFDYHMAEDVHTLTFVNAL